MQAMEENTPRLIILAAPSGAGKTTLCEKVLQKYPQVALSVSTTTRAKRDYENDAEHYYFVSNAVFDAKIQKGAFAEWAEVHGNRYGTDKEIIQQHLEQGRHVLFDIDVKGAMNLRRRYGKRALLVFVRPPSMEELRLRLEKRAGDSHSAIRTRLKNALNEIGWASRFDHQIVNDDLDQAFIELESILKRECL